MDIQNRRKSDERYNFQELRECNKMILQNNDAEKREEGTKILLEIVEKLCELTYICRKEGLLA